MGRIKDRDAKRAAAKVFSSGCGGGTRGPSVVDKRGQEQQCPHCDRSFKQIERLRNHIAKQHADLPEAPDAADAEPGSSAAAAAAAAPAAAAGAETNGSQANAAPSNGSASSSRASPAPAAAGGAAAAARGSGQAAGSSAAAPRAAPAMFDVGSRAGFYTEKSPKLMLHEWCMQQKRPKPRFKAVPDKDGGGFRARVVLPDPKHPGSDKDVVVWLDALHSAEHEEEALQRGAVAALQVVAGERSLEYVLPQRYRQLWGDLKSRAAERAEQQRRAAAAAADAKARAAAQRAAAASRAPVAVVMSDAQRQAVEGLMRELAPAAGVAAPPAAGLGGEGSDAATQLVDGLLRAGFSHADSLAAVKAVGPQARADAAAAAAAATAAGWAGGRGATRVARSHDGLQPYLDWLCLHLPLERLPARYRPGGSSGTVGVLRLNSSSQPRGGQADAAAQQQPGSDSAAPWQDDPQDDPHVARLVRYGYPADHACAALAAARGDLLAALHVLQQQLLSGGAWQQDADGGEAPLFAGSAAGAGAGAGGGASAGAVPAAWRDEGEVLGAIYGDDLTTRPGHIALSLDSDQGPGKLQLLLWCPLAPAPYPEAVPLLALACPQLQPALLLHLTAKLAAAAARCVGEPMVHELAVTLREQLEDLDALHRLPPLPPPYDQPASALSSAAAQGGAADGDGFSSTAQQHAAAAEALLGDDESSTCSSSSSGSRRSASSAQRQRRPRQQLSPEQQAADSRRLADYFARLQTDMRHAPMRAARAKLPAAACRAQLLAALRANDVVVVSGATGCGKSTQVPQFILEHAAAHGSGGGTSIIVCQPRRIAAVGLATRVAAEVGDPAGVGGLVGYSVRLDTRAGPGTRLLFCTTGVLLRRLMSDPELAGVSHVVLDEVHERSLDSDLLLLLLRRSLLLAPRQQPGSARASSGSGRPPPKVVLMSATADAELFGAYFSAPGPGAALTSDRASAALSVGQLSIPGFTHPVRQLWLEDALQQTGVVIGKASRYARKKAPRSSAYVAEQEPDYYDASAADSDEDPSGGSGAAASSSSSGRGQQQARQPAKLQPPASSSGNAHGGGGGSVLALGADAPAGPYSAEVLSSLAVVDASLINYDLIEALLVHVASVQQRNGPAGLLEGWRTAPPGACEAACAAGMGAVLIFMPGAPEIDRLVRQLSGSPKLAAAVGGPRALRVLPLHGGLPPGVQARVFERPPPGVLKVVVATNVAETSLTIDDVTVVIDTGRHKEMSYDPSRGLSRLAEAWVSQAAAQQRRGRAGRVAPGVCYRLFPARTWARLAPQQPPEVLRVPLAQLCLTTKAALLAALPPGAAAPALGSVLACLLTPPPPEAVAEAVAQLTSLGALEPACEALSPLGSHLAAMPMDAPLGKALLYGALLRCASPLLTIAAALAHGRPLWVSPPPDKRAEVDAARQALAPAAYAQRSDHLAVVAAFNAWSSARASGGRSAAADFARTCCVAEQVLEAIAKGRLDFAATLVQRGFLPDWYVPHLQRLQQHGRRGGGGGGDSDSDRAQLYGADAVAPGGPDEFSHNARIIKAAIAAGFYPRILRVEVPARYQAVSGGAVRVEAAAGAVKLFERGLGRVWLHPASVCFKAGSYPSGWLVFTQLVETSRPFVREASMVPLYSLLVFGGELEVLHDQNLLLLDGWAKFKAPARVGVLIKHLRQAVAGLLAAKIRDPSLDLAGQRVVGALHSLLSTDGF